MAGVVDPVEDDQVPVGHSVQLVAVVAFAFAPYVPVAQSWSRHTY